MELTPVVHAAETWLETNLSANCTPTSILDLQLIIHVGNAVFANLGSGSAK
jgi:hypothetical protein